MSWSWSVKWEPRDLWVGLYWDRRVDGVWFYVCLVPTIVIIGAPEGPDV